MYILFDIGATKMRVATSFDGKSFDKRYIKIAATPKQFKVGVALLRSLVRELSEHAPRTVLRKVTGVAGGIAVFGYEKGSNFPRAKYAVLEQEAA